MVLLILLALILCVILTITLVIALPVIGIFVAVFGDLIIFIGIMRLIFRKKKE